MKKFTLVRNHTDRAIFEIWTEDEKYLVAIIHEDHLGEMGKFGAGSYGELVLVEEGHDYQMLLDIRKRTSHGDWVEMMARLDADLDAI